MALLPLWLIGLTLVIALVSVIIDGTFSRKESLRVDTGRSDGMPRPLV